MIASMKERRNCVVLSTATAGPETTNWDSILTIEAPKNRPIIANWFSPSFVCRACHDLGIAWYRFLVGRRHIGPRNLDSLLPKPFQNSLLDTQSIAGLLIDDRVSAF